MKQKLLLILLIFPFLIFSQSVGINTENPNKNTELEIVSPSSSKGIMIPRLTEEQRDVIPLSNEENSLLIYNITEDCYNYYNFSQTSWISLCGKAGKAVFEVDCSQVKVVGEYLTEHFLNGLENYIVLKVMVTKPGDYTISATAPNSNGYYFTTSGTFLAVGEFELQIPALGTPVNVGTDELSLLLNGDAKNGADEACILSIEIQDGSKRPNFAILCNTVAVKGLYKVNVPLDNTNVITLNINASVDAIGSVYSIKTNTVDGISFSSSGVITSTNQSITLQGTGIPNSYNMKKMTISTNSTSSVATCDAYITVTYSKKKIATIGMTSGYGYDVGQPGAFPSNQAYNLLTTPSNFGILPTSLVNVEGIDIIRLSSAPGVAGLQRLINEKIDILVTGFGWIPSASEITVLNNYLVNKGVIVAYMENSGSLGLAQAVFNDIRISGKAVNAAGAVYQLSIMTNDITSGVFGDIRGKFWGEDASATYGLTGLPANDIEIYSYSDDNSGSTTAANQGFITGFRAKSKHFIWFGDGGFNSSDGRTSAIAEPFKINTNTKMPVDKYEYGRGTIKFPVVNSTIFANSIAWAIKISQIDGINTN